MRKWRIWLAVAVWALAILIQKPLWFGRVVSRRGARA